MGPVFRLQPIPKLLLPKDVSGAVSTEPWAAQPDDPTGF